MRFDLKRPCANCPFRKDSLPSWLGEARAEEIADAVLGRPGVTFACHRTTKFEEGDEGEEHTPHPDEQHCAGAMILADRTGAANQMLQIAERLGIRNPDDLDPDAEELVFSDGDDFIDHHS